MSNDQTDVVRPTWRPALVNNFWHHLAQIKGASTKPVALVQLIVRSHRARRDDVRPLPAMDTEHRGSSD